MSLINSSRKLRILRPETALALKILSDGRTCGVTGGITNPMFFSEAAHIYYHPIGKSHAMHHERNDYVVAKTNQILLVRDLPELPGAAFYVAGQSSILKECGVILSSAGILERQCSSHYHTSIAP